MIVFGVSGTVFLILMALGVCAHLADGVSRVRSRTRRRKRAASLYGTSVDSRSEEG